MQAQTPHSAALLSGTSRRLPSLVARVGARTGAASLALGLALGLAAAAPIASARAEEPVAHAEHADAGAGAHADASHGEGGHAEGAAAGAHHSAGLTWITPVFGGSEDGSTGLVWLLINFAVLVFALEKIMFSKLRAGRVAKHNALRAEVDRAAAARAEAEAVIANVRERLATLDAEVEEIKASARERAEADARRIVADATRDAEKIRELAQTQAAQEARSAMRALETELVDRAMQRAETVLRERAGAVGTQPRLVANYIQQLQGASLRTTGAAGSTTSTAGAPVA